MISKHNIEYFEFKQNKENIEEGGNIFIKLNSVKAKNNQLEIKYTFRVEYKQKAAIMTIKGTIFADTADAKKGQQLWQKEKKLPEDVNDEILNEIANFNRVRAAGVLRALRAKIEIVKEEPKEAKPAA
ncbi:MAG: hypothetical protein NZ903_03055 [Candidatus Micrarchaeota archaeon]|nr:hypothetical protein [Candidatus Micrarchaeota archaeon]